VAIAAPLAIAAGEATRVRDDAAAGSACGRGRLAFVAAPVLAYAALRLAAVGVSAPSDFTGGFVDRARLVLRAVGALAAMSLDPFRPRAVIALRDLPNAPMEVLGALVLVAGVYLVVRVARRGTPHEAQALALCVGGVMPVAQIIPLQGFALTSDRYLYLPLAGLAILTAIWVSDRARARWIPTGAAVAAGALAVAGAVGVRVRNDQMQSAVVFWATEAHRSGPNEPASFESLGEELQRASHPELAGEAFVRSLERTPALPRDSFFPIVARLRLAQCLSALGEVSAAEDADREVIARQPDLVDHYVELARVSATGGDVTGARAALAAGEVQSPGNPVLAAAAEEVEVRARAAALAASLAHDWSGPEPRPSLAQRALRRAELLSTLGLVREAEGAYIAVLDAGDASPAAVAEAADVLTLRGTSDGLDAVEHWLGDHGAESPDAAVLREALRSRREEERDVERARATALGK
jgi:tetratricopeptide (TPR) repeat protein